MPDIITLAMAKAYSDSKGGYTKTEWKTIIDTQGEEVPFEVNDGEGTFQQTAEVGAPWEQISNGDTCKVVWDGREYIVSATVEEGATVIIDREDLPFNFWIDYWNDIWDVSIYAKDDKPYHTFAWYLQTETIVPIDPKYLPSGSGGGGLTVVEIGEVMETENYQLSESEIAAFNAAAESDMPIIVKFGFNGMKTSAVFFCMKQGDVMTTYMGSVQNWEIIIMCTIGQCQVMVQERP